MGARRLPVDLGVGRLVRPLDPLATTRRVARGCCRAMSIRSRSDAPGGRYKVSILSQRRMVGNFSGNPGADTRHYRTASDEIVFASEQPGWVSAGPAGRLGTDS